METRQILILITANLRTATINGETKTVYGSQANLDKAISEGDITVTPNPSDTYTPGTRGAAQAYGAELADQEDSLDFALGRRLVQR